MTNITLCQVCGNKKTISVNTYKHKWLYCNLCGSASRQRKKRYLFSFTPRFFLKLIPKLKLLVENPEVIDDNSKIYDYMATENHIKRHQVMKVFENFMDGMIRKYKINIDGKRILDISGGNGSFIKQFEKYGAVVAMTEYNENSVDYAKNNFHIEAVKFNFNKDSINDLFKRVFDLIFLRAAIMFCSDLNKFLIGLKRIIHGHTLIIVYDSISPSLGTFLRWQIDDYTYLVLYKPETLIKIFEGQGFELISHDTGIPYHFNEGYGIKMRLFNYLYGIVACLRSPDRDRRQKSSHFIFKPFKNKLSLT